MKLLDELRVRPGDGPSLDRRDPGARLGADSKSDGLERLAKLVERLGVLHNRLYAEARRSMLLVLQGMDASGKDGVIRTVFTGVNPQGCRVEAFKAPTADELAHDFLWRVHARCPVVVVREPADPTAVLTSRSRVSGRPSGSDSSARTLGRP